MQGTADVHHAIADTVPPQPAPALNDPTALVTAGDMLNPEPTGMQGLVGPLLRHRQRLAAGCLRRHADRHLGQGERQEAQSLHQPAPGREGSRGGLGQPLVLEAASRRLTEQEDEEPSSDQEDIFNCMVLCRGALTLCLGRKVLGADDASFGAVMGTRGDLGAAAGTAITGAGSSSGTTTVAASASATLRCCASAVRERVGASPRARSAVRNTGRRTCIHG
jgi:hypothetical protein